MTVFPDRVEAIDAALMTSVLAERYPGVVVSRVDVVEVHRAGEGLASTADRVVVDVHYLLGTDRGLPDRMVIKTMLGAPHAPAAMYENEVRFYLDLRRELSLETPAVFGGSIEAETGRFGLLLEDLTSRAARFPNATEPVSVDEIASLLDQLARLHARYWASPRFHHDLRWLPTPLTGGMADVFSAIGRELVADQVARWPFKAELIEPLGCSVNELWELLEISQALMAAEPTTVLHGDPHIGNTYLVAEGGGLLDWQLMMRGCWAHDVVYLLMTGLDPTRRRESHDFLLRLYLQRLSVHGVAEPPDLEAARLACRQAAIWGLVIGWLITPPENYGHAITVANLERVASAVDDLGALAALRDA